MGKGKHYDETRDRVGVYYKYTSSSYRKHCLNGCKGGFHKQYWQAHHILPGTVFNTIDDPDGFIKKCLGVTDYNINHNYSMAGLPRLRDYILYFKYVENQKPDSDKEKISVMKKWTKIKKKNKEKIEYPDDFPVHNPVSFGHVIYNADVKKYLKTEIFDKLEKKTNQGGHFEAEDIKSKLELARDHFWEKNLNKPGAAMVGGGGCIGIKDNFKHRYGKSKNGWWKPMCMAKVRKEPGS